MTSNKPYIFHPGFFSFFQTQKLGLENPISSSSNGIFKLISQLFLLLT